MSRRILAIVAVIVVLLVIGGAAAYVLLTAPPPAKVLVVGTTDDETTFDPADAYDYFSNNILQNTMGMLLTYVPGQTTLTPDMLTQVPTKANGGISADELNYTLHLKSGLKFEDGSPINSSTLKYSIDRVVKLNGEPAFLFGFIVKTTEYWDAKGAAKDRAWVNYTTNAVKIVDSTTVKIWLRQKWSPFVYLLALPNTAPVDPKSILDDKLYPNVIVSSGPYRLSKYLPHQRYELEANPNYYGTPPKMSRVTIVRYTTAVDLKLALTTGAIDVAYRSLLPPDFKDFKSNANFKTLEGASPFIRYVVFNVCSTADRVALACPRTTMFSDSAGKLARKGLAAATNRTDVNVSAYSGTVKNLYSLVPAGMIGHAEPFQSMYGSNPNLATARSFLTQAGYSATNKLTFTLWYSPSHYGDPEIFVAQAMKRAWEATGMVSVTLDHQEWSDYKASWRAGSFDAFLLGWFPDYFDADDYLFPFLHWASGGSKSFGNWYHNNSMDLKINEEGATADAARRGVLFGEIQDGLAADVPYLPLFQAPQTVVFKPNVSGIILDPIQFFRYFTISA